jgi:putative nucleotidyltransferase with HDIG domain
LEHTEDLSYGQRRRLIDAGIKSVLMVPMIWQGDMIGVLSVATQSERGIDVRDIQFLSTVATQVTAIIHMEALVEELRAAASRLQGARADTVILLAGAAEAHDQTTGRHLHRVREISQVLARELGYSEEEVHAIGLGAVLHDIGKIRVPETILLSPAQLDDEEWELMKRHTTWGAEFLAGRQGFELAASIAAAHHERWDGSGYPLGLAGEAIPDVATIVSVADSLDAITNDRPYRTGRPLEWAVREIRRCSGEQFSPRVVDALLRLHARHALPLLGDEESSPERAA